MKATDTRPRLPLQIRPAAGARDTEVAADVVGRAFAALQACAWLLPDLDEAQRVPRLSDVFGLTVAHAMATGAVYLATTGPSPDGGSGEDEEVVAGAAVWLDRITPAGEIPGYDEGLWAATRPVGAHERFAALDLMFEEHHPQGRPHHHLAFLAVEPAHQRRGIGTALLAHSHAVLDELGVPAYLEASGRDNAALYARCGYARFGTPFVLPNAAEFFPMWREPHPGGPS